MKQFEAFLGNEFKAWAEDDKVKIKKIAASRLVVVTQELLDGRKAVTTFNLDQLPAYAFVE